MTCLNPMDILGDGPELAYLAYMANRLAECRRVLKPAGSIWLHCDPTMSHYLKVLMDVVWGRKAFKNEVVWKRFNFHADAKRFGAITDRILFYSGGDAFNPVRVPYSELHQGRTGMTISGPTTQRAGRARALRISRCAHGA